jgi:hypothetical protein
MKITNKSLKAKAKEIKLKATKVPTNSVLSVNKDEEEDESILLGGLFGDEDPAAKAGEKKEEKPL